MKKLSLFIVFMIASMCLMGNAYAGWRCTATNYSGNGVWYGKGPYVGIAQNNAIMFCQNALRTQAPGTCHIIPGSCVPTGYQQPMVPVGPVVPPPVAYGKFVCTAVGQYGHRAGTGASYNLAKAQYRAINNCSMNGGVNCQVVSSPTCPVG